jgi:hypothetical protein
MGTLNFPLLLLVALFGFLLTSVVMFIFVSNEAATVDEAKRRGLPRDAVERKGFEGDLLRWISRRLLRPRPCVLLPGSVVELVARESSVTVWKNFARFMTTLFPALLLGVPLFGFVFAVATEIAVGRWAANIIIAAVYVGIFVVAASPAWEYLILEWERLHKKLIVTTSWVLYKQARFYFSSFIFGTGAKVVQSGGTTAQLRETGASTDIQDLTGEETSKLEDWLDRLAYKVAGVSSLILRSNYFGAGDPLKQFSNADWLENVLEIIQGLGERFTQRFSLFYRLLAETEFGKVDASPQAVQDLMRRSAEFKARNQSMLLDEVEIPTFDFWLTEDPGVWTPGTLKRHGTGGFRRTSGLASSAPLQSSAPFAGNDDPQLDSELPVSI